MLEYANSLVAQGYKLDTTLCLATAKYPAGFTDYGRACVREQLDGTPVIVADPAVVPLFGVYFTCDQKEDPSCAPLTIQENHFAYELSQYKSSIDYLWDLLISFQYGSYRELGVFNQRTRADPRSSPWPAAASSSSARPTLVCVGEGPALHSPPRSLERVTTGRSTE